MRYCITKDRVCEFATESGYCHITACIKETTIDDNRFALIEKYKQKLIEGTNISDRQEEMAVIDSILFRFWQMGWLDKLEEKENE